MNWSFSLNLKIIRMASMNLQAPSCLHTPSMESQTHTSIPASFYMDSGGSKLSAGSLLSKLASHSLWFSNCSGPSRNSTPELPSRLTCSYSRDLPILITFLYLNKSSATFTCFSLFHRVLFKARFPNLKC